MARTKLTPERDYAGNGYQPFGKPFDDLCGHCRKYYRKLFDDGLTESAFPPACNGHALESMQDLRAADFDSEEEYEDALVLADPVTWAFKEFASPESESGRWEARWYQREMLSCTSQLKVLRAGRRIGKTEELVIEVLHHIYLRNDHTVLVIAPYERQVTRFFDELKKFVRKSNSMTSSVVRETKNPSRVEFANGSKVLGFSSGSKTAARSDKIRGQDANLIIIDEVDYIGDEDMEAVMAILASHPDCRLCIASTPTGEHKKFYAYCTVKDSMFKEFHYISSESPSWTKPVEAMFKATYSRAAYEHEFFAEFGQQLAGVYRNELLDASLYDYDMDAIFPTSEGQYALGIDWNKNAGTHMLIVEYLPGQGFKLAKKIIIPKSEFIQTNAVESIIRLDQIWNFKGIWVDRGYGTVQVEMLKKHGIKTPGSTIHRRVWSIAMNEMIEIRDPASGAMVKKPSKPFLVETLAKQLEDGQLILPESEDTVVIGSDKSMGLVQQMRNYKVEGHSVLGLPRYSQGQDHTLVALQLAVTGFILEFGDLRHVDYLKRVVFAGNFGEDWSPDMAHERMVHESSIKDTRKAVARNLDKAAPAFGFSQNMGSVYQQQGRKKIVDDGIASSRGFNNYLSRGNLNYKGRQSF